MWPFSKFWKQREKEASKREFATLLDAALGPKRNGTDASQPQPDDRADGWGWWASRAEDTPYSGPFSTRDDAVRAATVEFARQERQDEDGRRSLTFRLCEARQDPLRLADWIGPDRLLERAEDEIADSDRILSDTDDGPFFNCADAQERDLIERIERACDEWQAAHGLVFTCNTFSAMRSVETLTVDLPARSTEAARIAKAIRDERERAQARRVAGSLARLDPARRRSLADDYAEDPTRNPAHPLSPFGASSPFSAAYVGAGGSGSDLAPCSGGHGGSSGHHDGGSSSSASSSSSYDSGSSCSSSSDGGSSGW